MRSGASTPIRSRQRATTVFVATQRPSRKASLSEPEHLVVVVEAVEVVGDADRVGRDRMRRAPLGRLGDDLRELGEPLDEVALLRRERRERCPTAGYRAVRVAQDAGDAGVRVLHVVDRVLLRLLRGEVDVDLDRLVVTARDEVPAGGVDADLVHELVEEDDVAAPLRHLRRRAARGSGGRAGRSAPPPTSRGCPSISASACRRAT